MVRAQFGTPGDNALYWTDINRSPVHRFDASTPATNTWIFSEPVASVNLITDTKLLLLVMGSQVALWSPRAHPKVRIIYSLGSVDVQLNLKTVAAK